MCIHLGKKYGPGRIPRNQLIFSSLRSHKAEGLDTIYLAPGFCFFNTDKMSLYVLVYCTSPPPPQQYSGD